MQQNTSCSINQRQEKKTLLRKGQKKHLQWNSQHPRITNSKSKIQNLKSFPTSPVVFLRRRISRGLQGLVKILNNFT
jgi:division protein CdvB (Snf7/Vps24/ESCRT-III family)